jgi:hypothetical protein
MRDYVNTFWAPSTYGKSVGVPTYEIYAIVGARKNKADQDLLAWRMEVRGVGIYHPEYGIVARENFHQYNFFVKDGVHARPDFRFSTKSSKYYYLCDNLIDLTKILFHKGV